MSKLAYLTQLGHRDWALKLLGERAGDRPPNKSIIVGICATALADGKISAGAASLKLTARGLGIRVIKDRGNAGAAYQAKGKTIISRIIDGEGEGEEEDEDVVPDTPRTIKPRYPRNSLDASPELGTGKHKDTDSHPHTDLNWSLNLTPDLEHEYDQPDNSLSERGGIRFRGMICKSPTSLGSLPRFILLCSFFGYVGRPTGHNH